MQQLKAKELFLKYQEGKCTPAEQAIVENWLTFGEAGSMDLSDEQLGKDLDELQLRMARIPNANRRVLFYRSKIAVAASMTILLSIGLYFYTRNLPSPAIKQSVYVNDVAAGGNKAVLTLGNGKVIALSDSKTSVLIDAGKFSYADGTPVGSTIAANEHNVANNSISTPRGGQYQVVLPDGTKVWLNAASTLKFPSTFTHAQFRQVELSGEGYFEVAKDSKHPFIVKAAGQEVEVLGTHFNINAYSDYTSSSTTLLEGRVQIKYNEKKYLLMPGQQAVASDAVQVKQVDTEAIVGWKEGNFIFVDNNIETIMGVLQRWYDVSVVYDGADKRIGFNAEISRERSLIQVLKALEKSGSVRFKVEGRRVTVM